MIVAVTESWYWIKDASRSLMHHRNCSQMRRAYSMDWLWTRCRVVETNAITGLFCGTFHQVDRKTD